MTFGEKVQKEFSVRNLVGVLTLIGLIGGGLLFIDNRYATQSTVEGELTALRCDLLEYQIDHVQMLQSFGDNGPDWLDSRTSTLLRRWQQYCGGIGRES